MQNQYQDLKQKVVEIYRTYMSQRQMTPVDAAKEIDTAIGGITAVRFNSGRRFTISNHCFSISIPYKGSRKEARVYALAYAGYLQAQQNGSIQPGEVHAGKGISTKHHNQGLDALLN
ncbi:hypothetical protein KY343_04920 [Candidatus Woesearchaeota archaeon]|nr:hypothetical protein [Candidatus Woesearchaeota archaeon]